MGPHWGGRRERGGPQEAERGLRYINLGATVANHRLPLSHRSTLQAATHLTMSWLAVKKKKKKKVCIYIRVQLQYSTAEYNYIKSHQNTFLTCLNRVLQVIQKENLKLRDSKYVSKNSLWL